jgi:hypothetical protein
VERASTADAPHAFLNYKMLLDGGQFELSLLHEWVYIYLELLNPFVTGFNSSLGKA